MQKQDVIVVGSGLAGLVFALKLAPHRKVTLISKVSLSQTNTSMAQGGVAAAISEGDSPQKHFEDTMKAGAGLCQAEVVRQITEEAAERILDLTNWGVKFDSSQDDGEFSLGKEGGHSERRILHISDHTGQSIHRHLLQKAMHHENIVLLENRFATDLLLKTHLDPRHVGDNPCVGVKVLNKETGEFESLLASQTVLATGGAGKAYLYTSNWEGATGDGIAMAYRAGARVANLEFMQFHPTCLFDPTSRNFLISEALRGEGGRLINNKGKEFTDSLAPRDIVARAIDSELKTSGAEFVRLDMTHHSREFLEKRFSQIFSHCLKLGIDMSESPIPVVPAAHYLCGGVLTDIAGRTDIENLYCLGESACTGLHGANRLASNSLLECMVTAHHCAETISRLPVQSSQSRGDLDPHLPEHSENDDEMIVIHHMWEEIRRLMWNYVGIVRSNRRLQRALHRLQLINQEIRDYYSQMPPHSDIEELRNIALVAELTVKCALDRKESRGIHFNLDYPETNGDWKKDSIL